MHDARYHDATRRGSVGLPLHHAAARCGGISCGVQKQTARGAKPGPFGSLKLPLSFAALEVLAHPAGYLHGRQYPCPHVPIAREVDSRTTPQV
jgi:hypothetical protein